MATSSTRRKAQLHEHRPDLAIIDIRGNVVTRLQKLADSSGPHALVLARAGLDRLNFRIQPDGRLTGDAVPDGIWAFVLETTLLVPAVGQGAIGVEKRQDDERMAAICALLDHYNTRQCALAERAFLQAMGGGCQSPVAACAEVVGARIGLSAIAYRDGHPHRGEGVRPITEAVALGEEIAATLRGSAPNGSADPPTV